MLHLRFPDLHGVLRHDQGTGRPPPVHVDPRSLVLHRRLRHLNDDDAILHLQLRRGERILRRAGFLPCSNIGAALVPRHLLAGRLRRDDIGNIGAEDNARANREGVLDMRGDVL